MFIEAQNLSMERETLNALLHNVSNIFKSPRCALMYVCEVDSSRIKRVKTKHGICQALLILVPGG